MIRKEYTYVIAGVFDDEGRFQSGGVKLNIKVTIENYMDPYRGNI